MWLILIAIIVIIIIIIVGEYIKCFTPKMLFELTDVIEDLFILKNDKCINNTNNFFYIINWNCVAKEFYDI